MSHLSPVFCVLVSPLQHDTGLSSCVEGCHALCGLTAELLLRELWPRPRAGPAVARLPRNQRPRGCRSQSHGCPRSFPSAWPGGGSQAGPPPQGGRPGLLAPPARTGTAVTKGQAGPEVQLVTVGSHALGWILVPVLLRPEATAYAHAQGLRPQEGPRGQRCSQGINRTLF